MKMFQELIIKVDLFSNIRIIQADELNNTCVQTDSRYFSASWYDGYLVFWIYSDFEDFKVISRRKSRDN